MSVLRVLALFVSPLAVLAQERELVRCELLRSFTLPGGVATAAAFAPDGTALATGGELGDLILRDLATGQPRWHEWPSDHWFREIAFTADGRLLAAAGRHLTLHDAKTGRELRRFQDAGPHGFALCADGARLAFARGNELRVVDLERDETVATHRFEYPVNDACFGPDGATLFAGDNAGRVFRVPPDGGTPELLFRHGRARETDDVYCSFVAVAGGELFHAASQGDLRRGSASFTPPGHVFATAVSASGRSFAAGGAERRVRWWTEAGARHCDLELAGQVSALAFSPDERTLFASTWAGEQALYRDAEPPAAVASHTGLIRDVALSPDGSVLALRGTHCVLQPTAGGAVRDLAGVTDIAVGRTGSEILVRRRGRTAVLEGRSGRETAGVDDEHPFHWCGLAAGPGNTVLATFGNELIDLATQERVRLPEEVWLEECCDVARAPDGSWALAGTSGIEGEFGALLVTDAAGKMRFLEDEGPVSTVAFSPDGKELVYGTLRQLLGMRTPGGRVRVRDARTLALVRETAADVDWWRFVDRRYALALAAGALRVWDAAELRAVQTLPVGAGHAACLSADARTLVVSDGREARVYRVSRVD